MIGYKAFDKDLKCRGYQFKVGKTFSTNAKDNELKLCSDTVFHFCRKIEQIERVSNYSLQNCRVCEVIAEGKIVSDDDTKYGTNKLTILRELTKDEIAKYNNCNSGNCNSGNRNSGNWNSGNWNSGNRNSGNWNSGNWNSGNRNSGNWNSGDWNSGNWNSGNRNSGNRNSGDRNSGNWNSGDFNYGFFNSDTPVLRMFNRDTDKTRNEIDFPSFLYFDLTVWVSCDTATPEEQKKYKKEIETYGGYLKTLSYKDAFRLAWDKADADEHKKLLALPNWNNEIFKEISGIDAEAEIKKETKCNQ